MEGALEWQQEPVLVHDVVTSSTTLMVHVGKSGLGAFALKFGKRHVSVIISRRDVGCGSANT